MRSPCVPRMERLLNTPKFGLCPPLSGDAIDSARDRTPGPGSRSRTSGTGLDGRRCGTVVLRFPPPEPVSPGKKTPISDINTTRKGGFFCLSLLQSAYRSFRRLAKWLQWWERGFCRIRSLDRIRPETCKIDELNCGQDGSAPPKLGSGRLQSGMLGKNGGPGNVGGCTREVF